ncbi:MAG: hypothetical protein ACREP7_18075, partial [Lysobacter sp.]
ATLDRFDAWFALILLARSSPRNCDAPTRWSIGSESGRVAADACVRRWRDAKHSGRRVYTTKV